MTTPRDRAPTPADLVARDRVAADVLGARHAAATARAHDALAAVGLTVTSELDLDALLVSRTGTRTTRVEFTSPDGSRTGHVVAVSHPEEVDSTFALVGRRTPSGHSVRSLSSRGLEELDDPVFDGFSNAELLAIHRVVSEDESAARALSGESGRDLGDALTWWLATSSRDPLALAFLARPAPSDPPRRERGRAVRAALLTAAAVAALLAVTAPRGGRS